MTKTEQLQIKARDAINFLEWHPALQTFITPLFTSLYFSIQKVCKRGYHESCKRPMQIQIGEKIGMKYKEEFIAKLKELKKEVDEKDYKLQSRFVTIWKKYEDVFGEPWKFDHVEYWGELGFYMFHGNTKKKIPWNDRYKNWQGYDGVTSSGRTFEEMIIKLASKFKKRYGNFDSNDFLTKEEKANHKKEDLWLPPIPCKTHRGYSTMKDNPKYINVSDAELNRRWVKWFSTTEYCKKNWGEEVERILSGKEQKY
jgi:hypothetical protein